MTPEERAAYNERQAKVMRERAKAKKAKGITLRTMKLRPETAQYLDSIVADSRHRSRGAVLLEIIRNYDPARKRDKDLFASAVATLPEPTTAERASVTIDASTPTLKRMAKWRAEYLLPYDSSVIEVMVQGQRLRDDEAQNAVARRIAELRGDIKPSKSRTLPLFESLSLEGAMT